MNNDLKIEFKDFIGELSTCISKEILLDDMENVKEDHKKNIQQYKTTVEDVKWATRNLRDINNSMYENKKILDFYKDILLNNSQKIDDAIIDIKHWNKAIIEDLKNKTEEDIQNDIKIIKDSIKNDVNSIVDVKIQMLINALKGFEKSINSGMRDINKRIEENSKQLAYLTQKLSKEVNTCNVIEYKLPSMEG